jgi:hypothetical protein
MLENLIPGFGFAKIIAVVFVVTTVFAGYKFAQNFVADYQDTQKEIVRVSIESGERLAQIEYQKDLAIVKGQFQDDKIALQETLLSARQSNLDDQEQRIENMGSAEHMADVAEADNGFSKGSERLTFRAQRATESIIERIESKTRHETLYSD